MVNTGLQVALTDFGCAIRTDNEKATNGAQVISHSGNTALWAPEVSSYFFTLNGKEPAPADLYTRADIWAVATIAYQLFGQPNPFLSGVRLRSSVNLLESDGPKYFISLFH